MFLAEHNISAKDFPDYIAIIGGGRWARVMLEIICNLVPSSVKISVHSSRNAQGMKSWVLAKNLGRRITVHSDYPKSVYKKVGAVIVVNAASDHHKAIKWALMELIPVLVEKPVTLSYEMTRSLVDLAETKKTHLSTAHVFLFANYIKVFSKIVSNENRIESIRVLWADSKSESRHGEIKSYDYGLPIYADCLPHILSILDTFFKEPQKICENLDFFKGGSHIQINMSFDEIPCEIELIRNNNSRQRIIEVNTKDSKLTLDFTCEPGTIYKDDEILFNNFNWDDESRPIYQMLSAFLTGVAHDDYDKFLDNSFGLIANQIIDQIAIQYSAKLVHWLNSELIKNHGEIKSDLKYALTEMLHINNIKSNETIESRIEFIYNQLKEDILIHDHD